MPSPVDDPDPLSLVAEEPVLEEPVPEALVPAFGWGTPLPPEAQEPTFWPRSKKAKKAKKLAAYENVEPEPEAAWP